MMEITEDISFSTSSFSTSSENLPVDPTQFKTCNSAFEGILKNDDNEDDSGGADIEKHSEEVVADFADPDSGVFWGVMSEAEKEFLAKMSEMAQAKEQAEVADSSPQEIVVCKKDSGFESGNETLQPPSAPPSPKLPKPRPSSRVSLTRFGFDLKNRRGYSRGSLRRGSINIRKHILVAPKTPKWSLKPKFSSTPFPSK